MRTGFSNLQAEHTCRRGKGMLAARCPMLLENKTVLELLHMQ